MAGNAARRQAMSYGHMTKEVEWVRTEIVGSMQQVWDTDAAEDAVLGSRRATSCLPRWPVANNGWRLSRRLPVRHKPAATPL